MILKKGKAHNLQTSKQNKKIWRIRCTNKFKIQNKHPERQKESDA